MFSLPLAVLTLLTFHLVVKEPLIKHLPAPYDKRYGCYISTDFMQAIGSKALIVIISILIGILTHFLLDWLTDPRTYFGANLTNVPSQKTSIVLWADNIFSLLALLYLGYLGVKHKCSSATNWPPVKPRRKVQYWTGVLLFALLLVGYHYYNAQSLGQLTDFIVVVLSGFMLGVVIISATYKFRLKL
jgi:hypothetical protein